VSLYSLELFFVFDSYGPVACRCVVWIGTTEFNVQEEQVRHASAHAFLRVWLRFLYFRFLPLCVRVRSYYFGCEDNRDGSVLAVPIGISPHSSFLQVSS